MFHRHLHHLRWPNSRRLLPVLLQTVTHSNTAACEIRREDSVVVAYMVRVKLAWVVVRTSKMGHGRAGADLRVSKSGSDYSGTSLCVNSGALPSWALSVVVGLSIVDSLSNNVAQRTWGLASYMALY